MKYVMFEHAGSGNHGCEAIVRTTTKILGKNEYYLQTLNSDEDKRYGIDKLAELIESKTDSVKPNSFAGYKMRIKARLHHDLNYDTLDSLYRHKELIKKGEIALSIGGDNYCYKGIIDSIRDKLHAFGVKNTPCVLWGCSIDENYLDELVVKDLRLYTLITARESLTIETLNKYGIRNTVVSCADPAFTLDRQSVEWNTRVFEQHDVIGINVSDFMGYYNSYPNATYRNFKMLLDYLLKNTDNYIALIPHVRQEGNDDAIPSRQLADEINSDRILIVDEDYNCMQLKDIIARCKMFIGCRTHSTIAAYSSCVPTLVVGYSVKARGIAKDIFGEYEDLLVDVREFESDNDLMNKYLRFKEREDELRQYLQTLMPDYIKRAYLAKDALLRIKP